MRIWCLYLLGLHPFPFRTRRLSLKEPMILQGKPCGKVGRRQIHHGFIAQLVEQRTENPRVLGSIPSEATMAL